MNQLNCVCYGSDGIITYGDGFNIMDMEVEHFRQFILNHAGTLSKTLKQSDFDKLVNLNSIKEIDEYLESINYACLNSCLVNIGAIISNVMFIETGVRFQCEPNDPTINNSQMDIYIILPSKAPWDYNNTEISLTSEKFDSLVIRYMKELDLV